MLLYWILTTSDLAPFTFMTWVGLSCVAISDLFIVCILWFALVAAYKQLTMSSAEADFQAKWLREKNESKKEMFERLTGERR
jgi:hypothetical protein